MENSALLHRHQESVQSIIGKFELGPSSQRRPNLAWGTNESVWLRTADFRSGPVNGHRQSHLACLKSDHKQTKLGNEAEKVLSEAADLMEESLEEETDTDEILSEIAEAAINREAV